MNQGDLGRKITSGLIWTYMERMLAQCVSVLVTIILARLLLPKDYGIVSIVTIFITICDTLVVGGFSDTLIQKSNADDLDFSTLFWFVLVLSIFVYFIVFACSQIIESFFRTELVAATLRVMAIRIPINAIKSIQSAYISKHMKYRYFFFATLIGTGISAIIGIIMAYAGFGVWALVTQYLTNSLIDTIIIWFTCGWHPHWRFSISRLKELYSFGWKMQLSSLLATFYAELESFCIGRKYSSVDLAYYEKGRQFPKLIMHNVQTSVSKVMLPAFSLVQTDRQRAKALARRSIRTSSYVMFPLLIGLIICAEEFVIAVLTVKWVSVIPFLRILSVYFLCEPIMSVNKQIVIATGHSKKYLIMEIEKKSIGIFLLLSALFFSDKVITIAIAVVVTQLISIFIQSQPLKSLINYPISEQAKDVISPFLLCSAMIIPIIFIKLLNINPLIKLILEVFAGAIIYLGLSITTKNNELKTICGILPKLLIRKRNK